MNSLAAWQCLARSAGGGFPAHLAAEEPRGAHRRGLAADFQGGRRAAGGRRRLQDAAGLVVLNGFLELGLNGNRIYSYNFMHLHMYIYIYVYLFIYLYLIICVCMCVCAHGASMGYLRIKNGFRTGYVYGIPMRIYLVGLYGL